MLGAFRLLGRYRPTQSSTLSRLLDIRERRHSLRVAGRMSQVAFAGDNWSQRCWTLEPGLRPHWRSGKECWQMSPGGRQRESGWKRAGEALAFLFGKPTEDLFRLDHLR